MRTPPSLATNTKSRGLLNLKPSARKARLREIGVVRESRWKWEEEREGKREDVPNPERGGLYKAHGEGAQTGRFDVTVEGDGERDRGKGLGRVGHRVERGRVEWEDRGGKEDLDVESAMSIFEFCLRSSRLDPDLSDGG